MAKEEKRQQQKEAKQAQLAQRKKEILIANAKRREQDQQDQLNMLAKLQAGQLEDRGKSHSVLSQITSKLAHAEEIDMRLNRRKETIIKLQNYLMNADDFSESSSDSD